MSGSEHLGHTGSAAGPEAADVNGSHQVAGTGEARARLALALDFDDSVEAMRWALRLRGSFGVAKVGLELFSAAGPSVVAELVEAGFKVFVDMKLADIPTTTRKAARVLGALGASYLTVHTCTGPATLAAGVEGLLQGAAGAGLPAPVPLGVTVLTSEPDAPAEVLAARVALARDAGCRGIVCAAADLPLVRSAAPELVTVVPGIRLAGTGPHDHGRASSPAQALARGADLLVVGRAVTEAADPDAAAAQVVAEVAAAIGGAEH